MVFGDVETREGMQRCLGTRCAVDACYELLGNSAPDAGGAEQHASLSCARRHLG